MFDNWFAQLRQEEQLEFERTEAATARQWQEEMWDKTSTTQYQNAVKDMKAAGLNPMMMYGKTASVGGTTGSPVKGSGGIASASGEKISNIISSAMQYKLQKPLNEATIKAQQAQAKASSAVAGLNVEKALTEKYNREMSEGMGIKTSDSMPMILKYLGFTTGDNPVGKAAKKVLAPSGGEKGKWIKAGGKLFNLSVPAQRNLFLMELNPNEKQVWKKAFNKKFGDKL